MIKLKIEGIDEVTKDLDNLLNHSRRAMRIGMNDAHGKAYTKATQAVKDVYNIKSRDFKKKDATKRATIKNLRFVMVLKTPSVPLLDFTMRGDGVRKKGVSYKVLKKKRATIFKHAFVNKSKKSHKKYVLIRNLRSGARLSHEGERTKRYPITPLTVITPTTMWENVEASDVYIKEFISQVQKRYLHALDAGIKGYLKKGYKKPP